jgi:hypothetical protein
MKHFCFLDVDEKQARRIGEARHEASVIQQRQESKNVSLDNLFEQMKPLIPVISTGVEGPAVLIL